MMNTNNQNNNQNNDRNNFNINLFGMEFNI